MEDLIDQHEIHKWKEELLEQAIKEQEKNADYSYETNGSKEKCDNCGCFINSHDHCPRCDY